MPKKLTRLHRVRAFGIARLAIAKAKGDPTKAEQIANEEVGKLGFDAVLAGLLLQLALHLIKIWMEKRGAAEMLGEDEETFAVPCEWTDEMDAEICAEFPEIMEPGKL